MLIVWVSQIGTQCTQNRSMGNFQKANSEAMEEFASFGVWEVKGDGIEIQRTSDQLLGGKLIIQSVH